MLNLVNSYQLKAEKCPANCPPIAHPNQLLTPLLNHGFGAMSYNC